MYQVQLWEEGNKVFARSVIPLRAGGTITVLLTLDSEQIIKALHARGVRFAAKGGNNKAVTIQGVEVGSLFGDIGKAIKKVAKNSVLKKALALGKALVTSPIGQLVAPQAVLAIKAAEGAAKLVAAAKSKNPKVAQKAKIALLAANAQAKQEQKAGRSLPLPPGIASRSADTRGAYRYLVTVARSAA